MLVVAHEGKSSAGVSLLTTTRVRGAGPARKAVVGREHGRPRIVAAGCQASDGGFAAAPRGQPVSPARRHVDFHPTTHHPGTAPAPARTLVDGPAFACASRAPSRSRCR